MFIASQLTWDNYFSLLGGVLAVCGVVGTGFAVRKLNWLSEAADSSLLRIVVNVLIPALILASILANPSLKSGEWKNILLAPVFGFGTAAIGIGIAFALGKFAGRFIGLTSRNAVCAFALCVGIYNYNYMPITFAKMHFGGGTSAVGVLLVHNLGVEICLWTIGLMLLGVTGVLRSWKRLLSPPIIAVLCGVVLNLANLDQYLPGFLLEWLHLLAACAVPMGLLLMGTTLADQWSEFRLKSGWGVIGAACLLRLGVLPFLFLLPVHFFLLPKELMQVIVMQAAMPAAVLPVLMVKHYGGDPKVAMQVTVGTLLGSILLIPLWLHWGANLAELRFIWAP